jgi:hypothetical protein
MKNREEMKRRRMQAASAITRWQTHRIFLIVPSVAVIFFFYHYFFFSVDWLAT